MQNKGSSEYQRNESAFSGRNYVEIMKAWPSVAFSKKVQKV